MHTGQNVRISLPSKTVKMQSGKASGNKKTVVLGEILGFVKFCYLPAGANKATGQGYFWYRQVPEEIFGSAADSEHVVSTSCLDFMSGGELIASEKELKELSMEAPSVVKVEVLHRPHIIGVSSGSGGNIVHEEPLEISSNGKLEHFKKENIKDVSKKKGFNLSASEPVDIIVSILSGFKKCVLHRPNQPNKKYSVHMYTTFKGPTKSKDLGDSKGKALYMKKTDSRTNSVCFVKYSNDAKDGASAVHYFQNIRFKKSEAEEMTLHVDILDGDRILKTKEFEVKVMF